MNNARNSREFTAKQNKIPFCRYGLVASKAFRATGFGRAEFPIGILTAKAVKIWSLYFMLKMHKYGQNMHKYAKFSINMHIYEQICIKYAHKYA